MAGPRFHSTAAHVRVPATSANLGPGYDALGHALDLVDDLYAQVQPLGLWIEISGEGRDLVVGEEHLVVRAMRAGFQRLGGQPTGVGLRCVNRIPHGRGLGSSAAAIVAGLLLARELAVDGTERLDLDSTLALAAELEGHPDNVAPCLLGGLTVAWTGADGRAHAVTRRAAADLRPVALVAPSAVATETARGLLPPDVSHADAAANAARAALLVAALTDDDAGPDARTTLLAATDDRLHQRYRAPAMPATAELIARLRADGLAAVVSGAGPSVLVLARSAADAERAVAAAPAGWRAAQVKIAAGARADRAGPDIAGPGGNNPPGAGVAGAVGSV